MCVWMHGYHGDFHQCQSIVLNGFRFFSVNATTGWTPKINTIPVSRWCEFPRLPPEQASTSPQPVPPEPPIQPDSRFYTHFYAAPWDLCSPSEISFIQPILVEIPAYTETAATYLTLTLHPGPGQEQRPWKSRLKL